MHKQSFSKERFYSGLAIGGAVYSVGTYFLYDSWYKEKGLNEFHYFNDLGEWRYMDKTGHIFTTYNQSRIMHNAARWTGLSRNKSITFGITMGMLLQTTIEVFDGFSEKWGFSWSDMGANVMGAGIFYAQQKYWDEQKILLKISSYHRRYSQDIFYSTNGKGTTSLQDRANNLFGATLQERYLKDYNTQTHWVSFNINSLTGWEKVPSWLNIAFGYSGENLFGGSANTWQDSHGNTFSLGADRRRYSQFLIAPDIDLSKIKVNSYFLQTIFNWLNIFKVPTPAIEINTRGEVLFHLIYL